VAVRPEYRRQGIGHDLWTLATERLGEVGAHRGWPGASDGRYDRGNGGDLISLPLFFPGASLV
jgi:GNAT superfamily N-acetyltransferase